MSTGMPRPLSMTVTDDIGVDDDFDAGADPGQGLVNRVIHHFIDEVVQGLDVGTAHVHAGAAADGFQSFQDLDIFCVVTSIYYCHKFLNPISQ